MATAYFRMAEKLANTREPVKEIANLKLKPEDWTGTPGGKIMAKLKERSTFDDLFHEYTRYGRSNGWTWNPDLKGAHKGKLLDGTMSAGECAMFAGNLQLLAALPRPYGLGLSPAPEYWPFSGKFNAGFVCTHDMTAIISPLQSNLRTRTQVQQPLALYMWVNHKVLRYAGNIYDPSYGTICPATDMLGLYQCKTTCMGSAERVVAKIKGHEYVVTTGASFGVEFLWRCVPETERPERPYKGPYTLTEAEG